jgi:hypothetical protein
MGKPSLLPAFPKFKRARNTSFGDVNLYKKHGKSVICQSSPTFRKLAAISLKTSK